MILGQQPTEVASGAKAATEANTSSTFQRALGHGKRKAFGFGPPNDRRKFDVKPSVRPFGRLGTCGALGFACGNCGGIRAALPVFWQNIGCAVPWGHCAFLATAWGGCKSRLAQLRVSAAGAAQILQRGRVSLFTRLFGKCLTVRSCQSGRSVGPWRCGGKLAVFVPSAALV